MGMFCFQCQEASKNTGCTVRGVCGKSEILAKMQDLLIYTLKGLAFYVQKGRIRGVEDSRIDHFTMDALFMTITNANFDPNRIVEKIKSGLTLREELRQKLGAIDGPIPEAAVWYSEDEAEFLDKAGQVGVMATENEDIRSLRELLTYGIKGMAAYAEHAYNLGYEDQKIYQFMHKGLAATLDEQLSADELIALVLECGQHGVEVMALLDKANTSSYGNPEITRVNIGVRNNPAILISGHDLRDLEELLKQSEGTGVDIYTHSEMLPDNL
jgi:hydroxylamine reductase